MQEPFNKDNENLQEEVQNSEELKEEFSTVFADPTAHTDKEKKNKKRYTLKIVAGVLAVAVLVGAVFGIKKWLPEKQQEDISSVATENVFSLSADSIDEVLITNASGELRIYKEEFSTGIQSDAQTETVIKLDGYDPELIDTSSLEQILSSVSSLDVYSSYDTDELAEYGLDDPEVTVKITVDSTDYTLSFGADTTDTSRCYASVSSLPSKVYVVSSNSKATVNVSAFDLAISTGIQAVEKNDNNEKYFDEEGALSTFDSIVLSGKKYSSPITFVPNTNGAFSSYAAFITTTPQKRIANEAEDLRDLFGTVTSSSSCVSFDQSAESLKKFGLDDPDIIVTMKLAGEEYTYLITAQPNTTSSFYVAASNDKLIRTVPITNLPFANKEEKDFYTLFMVLEAFADVDCFEMTGEVNAKFDISYDEDNEEYNIEASGTKVDAETFQNAYADFISTTGIDISVIPTSNDTTLTIKLYHKDDSPETTLSFKKVTETRYQYYVGGTAMGQITSTAYNNIVRSFYNLLKSE